MGFGKDGMGVIVHEQTNVTLGALAALDLAIATSGVSLDKDFRILKTECVATLTAVTSLEGAGLLLYMAQGELTDALIEENIEQNGPLSPGDRDQIEIADRWVKRVAVSSNDTVNNTERSMLNGYGGPMITFTPRWTFRRRRTAADGGWNWAVYNNGATLTTGTICRILATHYGVWVD